MIFWYIPVDLYLANYGLSTDQAGNAKSPLSDFPTCRTDLWAEWQHRSNSGSRGC
jgi:hypothetical protein